MGISCMTHKNVITYTISVTHSHPGIYSCSQEHLPTPAFPSWRETHDAHLTLCYLQFFTRGLLMMGLSIQSELQLEWSVGAIETYHGIQLFFWFMDAVTSTIWCEWMNLLEKAGSLLIVNDVFLQSKFKRPDHELHCFVRWMASEHEGWSLRDPLMRLSPISGPLESSSTQPQPADPALHQLI